MGEQTGQRSIHARWRLFIGIAPSDIRDGLCFTMATVRSPGVNTKRLIALKPGLRDATTEALRRGQPTCALQTPEYRQSFESFKPNPA